jgi:hypothetical protein
MVVVVVAAAVVVVVVALVAAAIAAAVATSLAVFLHINTDFEEVLSAFSLYFYFDFAVLALLLRRSTSFVPLLRLFPLKRKILTYLAQEIFTIDVQHLSIIQILFRITHYSKN